MPSLENVKGLAQLQKLLDTLPAKLEANVMRGALRAGMKPVRAAAKSNVRRVSGLLADGLKIGARIDRRSGNVTAYVVSRGAHAYIAKFVEYGTRPHLISVDESEKPINARLTSRRGVLTRVSMRTVNRIVLAIGNVFVGTKIHHPGAHAYPFMLPALDNQAAAAVGEAAAYMKKRLAKKEGLDTRGISLEGEN